MQCQCILSYPSANAGHQCSFRAQPGRRFCGHHIHCANVAPPKQYHSEATAARAARPSNTSRTGRLKRDNTAIRGIKMNSNIPPLSRKEVSVKGATVEKHQYRVYNVKTRTNMSILVWELLFNNGIRIREILQRYPDLINQKSSYSTTPLIAAIYKGNIDAVRLLVTFGADVRDKGSVANITQVSPLGVAAIVGHLDIFRYLLTVTTARDAQTALAEYVSNRHRSMMSWDTVMESVPPHTVFTDSEVDNIIYGLGQNDSIPLINYINDRFRGVFNRKLKLKDHFLSYDVKILLSHLSK